MPLLHLHAFWTRPLQTTPGRTPDSPIQLADFEALTWLTSALEARRHGGIRLVTDTRGAQFVRRTGLDWVYDAGISTALDALPASVNPQVFWAAGKLEALLSVKTPCAALDTDAVLWRPPPMPTRLWVLHPEDRRWGWYRADQEVFGACGFADPAWDWEADPVNMGIAVYPEPGFARRYAQAAIEFMAAFSQQLAAGDPAAAAYRRHGCDPMIFAEQRILALCARRERQPVGFLGRLHPSAAHMARNRRCLHLWCSKDLYRRCPEARVALVNHLIAHVRARHPVAVLTLERWGLAQPLAQPPPADLPAAPGLAHPESSHSENFCLLTEVRGVVWIEDPNVQSRRRAHDGSLVWVAETIRPEPGATFSLCAMGGDRVRIEQETGQPGSPPADGHGP